MNHFTSDFSYLPIWIIFTFPQVVRKIKIPPPSAIHPVTHVSIDPAKIALVSRPCEQFFPVLLYLHVQRRVLVVFCTQANLLSS